MMFKQAVARVKKLKSSISMDLSTHAGQVTFIVGFSLSSLVVLMISAAFMLDDSRKKTESGSALTFLNPSVYDAAVVCEQHVEHEYGDDLLRTYFNERSSRLDERKGVFKVFMEVDVGTLTDFGELEVHCFVNNQTNKLSYFRQFDHSVKQTMSTDVKFFSY